MLAQLLNDMTRIPSAMVFLPSITALVYYLFGLFSLTYRYSSSQHGFLRQKNSKRLLFILVVQNSSGMMRPVFK
jgi:hypothetical protein